MRARVRCPHVLDMAAMRLCQWLSLMALASGAAIWYFKQLRKDRADPVINPAWPSVMRPRGASSARTQTRR
jgi:hypothetical protein